MLTREQIDEIRNRVQASDATSESIAEVCVDRRELLEEVERLTKITEETEAQMHLRIRAGYDKTVADSWRAWAEKQRAAAFRRGVAAMREAAVKECWKASDVLADIPDMVEQQGELQILARRIRALPDPEDTE